MPSKSKAQAHLMAAAAHNPEISKETGIDQSVAHDFNQADKKEGNLKNGSKLPQHKTVKEEMRGLADIVQDAELAHDINDADDETLINKGVLEEMPQKFDAFAGQDSDEFVDKTAQMISNKNMSKFSTHGDFYVMKNNNGSAYIAYDNTNNQIAIVSGQQLGNVFHEESIAAKNGKKGIVYQIYMDLLKDGKQILSDTLHSDGAIRFWQKLISNHEVYVVADGEILQRATPEKFHKYWSEEENSPQSQFQFLLVK